jgi:hypothetical protein
MIPRSLCLVATLLAALVALPQLRAQPSGGPYGPQSQRYEIPAGAKSVIYVAPDAKAGATGASLDAPTTIESAIARAVTGDVLVLRGGVYRTGSLVLNQGITIQPYADEQPVLKGTRVATEWEALRENIWRTRWTTLFPQKPADWWRRNREGMRTPLHRFNNDMVFVDGRSLLSTGWEGDLDADTFYIDYEGGWVYIGTDPAGKLVEITAHDGGIIRTTAEVHGKKSDKKGYILRGLTLTQYAYRALEVEGYEPDGPADESKFGKDVVGTTLEHVTITHCSRVAGYFRGDRTVFRNCLVSDTSTEGLYLISSNDCLFERNIIARNNVEKITGYYPSAVKIFNQTHRVVCRDNLVIDQPDSNGIWYDVGNCDGVFINNWIQDCQDGFFYEISQRAICAGNVFVNCDKGVRSLNSAEVHVYHNTFVNTQAAFERTERSAVGDHFGWHPATGPDVDKRDGHIFVGNLVTADASYTRPLLQLGQTKPLLGKLTATQMARLEGNVYVRATPAGTAPVITWAPVDATTLERAFTALDAFRAAYPKYEAGSSLITRELGALFKSPVLHRLELTQPLAVEAKTPADVLKLLGWTEADARTPGAYPTRR